MRWVAVVAAAVVVGGIVGVMLAAMVMAAGDGPEFPY